MTAPPVTAPPKPGIKPPVRPSPPPRRFPDPTRRKFPYPGVRPKPKACESEELVACPVCKGTKVSPYTGNPCKCCEATGKITPKMAEIKARIRGDLSRRLRQQYSSESSRAALIVKRLLA